MEDYCYDCGWCEECREGPDLQPCTNCGKSVCHQCRSEKGKCHNCVSYDLPKNVQFITRQGDWKKINIRLIVTIFWGQGHHYHTRIEFGDKIKGRENINKKFETHECLKDFLTDFFNNLPKNQKWYVDDTRGNEKTRKWFYGEGD